MQLPVILVRHYFIVGLAIVIALAAVAPQLGTSAGPLHTRILIKTVIAPSIFFISGFTIRTEEFARAITNVRMILFIQSSCFALVPLVFFCVVSSIRAMLENQVYDGFIILSALPPAVSTSVLFAGSSGGSEAVALINATISTVLGVLLSPFIVQFLLGTAVSLPIVQVVMQVAFSTLLPMTGARHVCWELPGVSSFPFSYTSSSLLLCIVYASFCDLFMSGALGDLASVCLVIAVIVVLQLTLGALLVMLARGLRFTPEEVAGVVYNSSHRSLALGVLFFKEMFPDRVESMASTLLPMLLYHPVQLILASIAAPMFKAWVLARRGSTVETA